MDDRFLGTTAVYFVFNFCLLCSHRLPVSEGISQYQSHFLDKFIKYVLKDKIEIYRKNHADLKLEWSL